MVFCELSKCKSFELFCSRTLHLGSGVWKNQTSVRHQGRPELNTDGSGQPFASNLYGYKRTNYSADITYFSTYCRNSKAIKKISSKNVSRETFLLPLKYGEIVILYQNFLGF
ncbi:MAG: hypothetical protein BWY15_01950 [Firmicutes bacterium ADurb.Bin193]|nr:MAG: hypothetical protein BWY15_01950 [Firmicutes bacterium ADurb.Bin193]